MAATVGELMVLITGNTAGLEAALADASAQTEAFDGEITGAGAGAAAMGAGAAEAETSTAALGGTMEEAGGSADGLTESLGGVAAGTGAAAGGLGEASTAAEDAGASAEEASGSAGILGGAFGGAGTMVAAGVGIAGAAVGVFAVKSGQAIDTMTSNIGKQTGLSGNALQGLSTVAENVAAKVPISFNDAGNAVSTLYSRLMVLNGGIPPTDAQVQALTMSFGEFAVVTGTDVNTATDTMMKVFSQFHVPAADMTGELNNITQAAQYTHDPVSTLESDMQKMGPVFAEGGASVDDAATSMALMDTQGIKTKSAVSGLSTEMSDLEKNGMTSQQAFTAITSALNEYAETGVKSAALSKLTGQSWIQLSMAAKDGDFQFQKNTADILTNNNALSQAYNQNLTFGQQLTLFKTQLEEAFAPLGKSILNVLREFLQILQPLIPIITDLVNLFTKLPLPIQAGVFAITAIVGGAAVAGIALKMFNINITDIIKNVQKLKDAGLSQYLTDMKNSFTGGGAAATTEGASAAEEAEAASHTGVGSCPINPECLDKMNAQVDEAGKGMQELDSEGGEVGDAMDEASVHAGDFGAVIGDASEATADTGESAGLLGGLFGGVTDAAGGIVTAIGGAGAGLVGMLGDLPLVGGLFGGAADAAGGILAPIAAVGSNLLDFIPIIGPIIAGFMLLVSTSSIFRGAIGSLVDQFKSLLGWVGELAGDLLSLNFSKFGGDFVSGFEGGINTIKSDIMGFPSMMVSSIEQSGSTITSFFSGLWNTISSGAGQIGQDILNGLSSLTDIANKLANYLANIDWTTVINNFVNTITNAITNIDWGGAVNGLVSAISGMFGGGSGGGGKAGASVSDGTKSSLEKGAGDAAPGIIAKLAPALANLAVQLALLLPRIFGALALVLLEDLVHVNWGAVGAALESALVSGLSALGGWLWGQLSPIPGEMWTGFTTSLGSFGSWLWGLLSPLPGELWSGFTTSLGSFGTWLWGLISPLPGELWNGFTTALGSFGSWLWNQISSLPSELFNAITSQNWGQIASNILSGIEGIGGQAVGAIANQNWGQIGQAILTGIENIAGSAASSIGNAITGTLGSIKIGGVALAEGAYITSRAGGVLAVIGEGGEDEYVIPASKIGDPTAIAGLPRLAEGALVTGSVGSVNTQSSMAQSVGGTQPSTSGQGDINLTVTFTGPVNMQDLNQARQYIRTMGTEFDNYRRRKGISRG
ncbi:MAG: phage tail tape measure protein [Candidatus Korobacteraceae bacterium]